MSFSIGFECSGAHSDNLIACVRSKCIRPWHSIVIGFASTLTRFPMNIHALNMVAQTIFPAAQRHVTTNTWTESKKRKSIDLLHMYGFDIRQTFRWDYAMPWIAMNDSRNWCHSPTNLRQFQLKFQEGKHLKMEFKQRNCESVPVFLRSSGTSNSLQSGSSPYQKIHNSLDVFSDNGG